MVYAIKMHSICTKIKGNNFILTTLHQSKSIWYKYDDLPIWPTHIVTPIQNIWQGINIDIVQIVANVSLLPNNVTPTDISYSKKNNTFPFILTAKWPLTDWFLYLQLQKSLISSFPIQNNSYLTNYIDKPIYIQACFYTMRIFIS